MASTSNGVEDIAKLSKLAFHASQTVTGSERIAALHAMRDELEAQKDAILEANKLDMQVRRPLSSHIRSIERYPGC
jgi:glutamate-5-semialdehyde dehydrogenase